MAEYIAVQASRLARLASAHEFALLAGLIETAVLEAWRQASEPPDKLEHSTSDTGALL